MSLSIVSAYRGHQFTRRSGRQGGGRRSDEPRLCRQCRAGASSPRNALHRDRSDERSRAEVPAPCLAAVLDPVAASRTRSPGEG